MSNDVNFPEVEFVDTTKPDRVNFRQVLTGKLGQGGAIRIKGTLIVADDSNDRVLIGKF